MTVHPLVSGRRRSINIFTMRVTLLILFFICCVFMGYTKPKAIQQDTAVKKTNAVQRDSSVVDLRTISSKSLSDYRENPDFNYEENIVPVGWWQQFKHWLYQLLSRLLNNKGSFSTFKWLLIAIGVTALTLLIYKLSGMDLMSIFGRKAKSHTENLDLEDEEDIHIIDFEEALKQAIQAGNFRSAVRLLYLQSLKALTDQRLIDWQPDKTNHTYLQELHEKSFRSNFAELTDQFEYIWYGGFPIQQADFEQIQQSFQSLHQQISPKSTLS